MVIGVLNISRQQIRKKSYEIKAGIGLDKATLAEDLGYFPLGWDLFWEKNRPKLTFEGMGGGGPLDGYLVLGETT